MNSFFYFQPRNFRLMADVEGCLPRTSLKPDMRCGFGIATAAAVIGIGATAYGITSSIHAKKTANDQANHAHKQQLAADQIATVEGQAQVAIDAANASKKKWEYIAIGGVVLIVVGGVIYAVTRRK